MPYLNNDRFAAARIELNQLIRSRHDHAPTWDIVADWYSEVASAAEKLAKEADLMAGHAAAICLEPKDN